MKKHITLATATLSVFAISFMLPAYGTKTGYDCFKISYNRLFSISESIHDIWGWFYFGGFALSNLFFVIFAFMLLAGRNISGLIRAVTLLMCLHATSWFLFNLANLPDLKIGYYLWLGAIISLCCILYAAARANNAMPRQAPADPPTHG